MLCYNFSIERDVEKMEKKKENFLWVILAFCVILVGIGCFYLGTHFGNRVADSKKEEAKKEEDNNTNETEIEKLGQELFAMTNVNSSGQEYYLYKDTITNKEKLEFALSIIPDKEFELSEYAKNNEYPEECNGELGLTCYSRKIKKSVFEKYYHKAFGLDKKVTYEEFSYFPSIEVIKRNDSYKQNDKCNLEGNDIVCYNLFSGDIDVNYRYIKYDHSELVNENTLEVYTKFLGYKRELEYNSKYGEEIKNLYSDYNFKEIIGQHDYDTWSLDSPTKEELFEKYGSKAGTYKLTFNKDTDGNWYWVSTTAVK